MKTTRQLLNKLHDSKLRCSHCGKLKKTEDMQPSFTIDICKKCCEDENKFNDMLDNLKRVRD